MWYTTLFRPTQNLMDKLATESNIRIPERGLHCTLWGFASDEEREKEVIEALRNITICSFATEVLGFDNFDESSYVIRLKNVEELQRLHSEILRVSRAFDRDTTKFDTMAAKYGLERYNPHITIAKTVLSLSQEYKGVSMEIEYYSLLKKKNGIWQSVADFNF